MQRWMERVYAVFPLATYEDGNLAKVPTEPTLWTYPNDAPFDVDCATVVAALRLAKVPYKTLPFQSDEGAVNGRLPNLHLIDGSLLHKEEIMDWLQRQSEFQATSADGAAWMALFDRTLIPAIMAALYTEPCFSDYTRSLYHPAASSSSAILSKQMHRWRAQRARAERLQALKAKAGAWDDGTLAVEDLESAARQTLEAASALIASHPNEPWLLATSCPTAADAALFAQLQVIQGLPRSSTGQSQHLQRTLQQGNCAALREWYQATKLRL